MDMDMDMDMVAWKWNGRARAWACGHETEYCDRALQRDRSDETVWRLLSSLLTTVLIRPCAYLLLGAHYR